MLSNKDLVLFLFYGMMISNTFLLKTSTYAQNFKLGIYDPVCGLVTSCVSRSLRKF